MVELSILCSVSDKPICPGEAAQGPVSCGFILPSGRAQDHTYQVSSELILPGTRAQGPVSRILWAHFTWL
jgi:hypothetical protein